MANDRAGEPQLRIEVVFALAERQTLLKLDVPLGTAAGDAIERSGIRRHFPDVDFDACAIGVWGQPVPRDHRLRDGDRVEIYRPLRMDPREARRRLAAAGRAMGQKDGPPEDDDASG